MNVLRQIDKLLITGIFGLFALSAIFTGAGLISWAPTWIIFAMGIIVSVLLTLQFEMYRRSQALLSQQLQLHYQQNEALTAIYSTLDIRNPLPPMRGWAISPDFGTLLISTIIQHSPSCIAELGSGASTLLSAYCLQKLRKGKLVSIDHDDRFAALTRQSIEIHGLSSFAEVHTVPLKTISLDGRDWLWYDQNQLPKFSDRIDLLIIDGPPAELQANMRYPALPVLFQFLSDQAVLLFDDGGRDEEKQIVRTWLNAFPGFRSEYIPTEKGAFRLFRKKIPETQ